MFPYKGVGPALVDLLGNHVSMMFNSLQASTTYIKDGRLRGLAVTTAERAPSMPDLPTMAESGLPGYQTSSWDALFAPAGTPPEVVARLNEAAVVALADPDVQAKLLEFGAMTVGSTPEALAAHVKDELAKWMPVVEASGAPDQLSRLAYPTTGTATVGRRRLHPTITVDRRPRLDPRTA